MKEKKKRKTGVNYIDNKDFAAALLEYKIAVRTAKKNFESKPKIPTYIGECFVKIATHLSYHPSFINYSYRDEMVSDGIENCLMYFENFNPNALSKRTGKKIAGPFGYFTQIIWYAFLRRIAKERKQQYVKAKVMESSHIILDMSVEDIETLGKNVDVPFNSGPDMYSNISEFISNFEKALKEKKAKKIIRTMSKSE